MASIMTAPAFLILAAAVLAGLACYLSLYDPLGHLGAALVAAAVYLAVALAALMLPDRPE